MILKFNNYEIFAKSLFILRVHRHHHYCHNLHHNRHRDHRRYYYCFCVIVIATSGEEGRKSIMKEIGLGKELGDSPQDNVVKFIGCVTTQSKNLKLFFTSFRAFCSRSTPIFLLLFIFRQK